MSKVDKCICDTMQWISNVMSAQAKLSLEQDPVVSVNEIKGKLRELYNVCEPIVSQPKPKVDSPKRDEPDDTPSIHKNEDKEEMKNSETAQQNGECHVDESPVNMDLE